MKYTEEEILNALKVIKEVCAEFENCPNCPFYKFTESLSWTADCVIRNKMPRRWELNTSKPAWRAFV